MGAKLTDDQHLEGLCTTRNPKGLSASWLPLGEEAQTNAYTFPDLGGYCAFLSSQLPGTPPAQELWVSQGCGLCLSKLSLS